MSVTLDPERLLLKIARLLRAETVQASGATHFVVDTNGRKELFVLSERELSTIQDRLGSMDVFGDTALVTPVSYEALVSIESRFGGFSRGFARDGLTVEDVEHGLTYTIGPASDEYTAFLLSNPTSRDLPYIGAGLGVSFVLAATPPATEPQEPRRALDLARQVIPRAYTASVVSKRNRTAAQLNDFFNAFLFHLAYNLDIAVVQATSLDEYWRRSRLARTRKSRPDEIAPPKRLYVVDLTYHYQLAAATESPVLAFLSLYHVAEHFFEAVFNEDLVGRIRERLTNPGFSQKRQRDVLQLVKEIQTRLRVRAETVTFSELEALRLTLLKFVLFDELPDRLQRYDKGLVDHYRGSEVAFCGGDAVDVTDKDTANVALALAKRIYKTRNAIVHSKDGERAKFVPFKHDQVLAREIALLRFVAEDIIIGSSTVI